MSGWIDELAETLRVEALTESEARQLLGVAREVAHRMERKDTPLAAFLLGMHVACQTADGTARSDALAQAIGTTDALLPPAPEGP